MDVCPCSSTSKLDMIELHFRGISEIRLPLDGLELYLLVKGGNYHATSF